MLGLGADRSEAAGCKGGDKPAYAMEGDAAVKATLCLLNKERTSRGLGSLHPDSDQMQAAGEHNRLMLASTCFSHLCPGEQDLLGRLISTGYLPCACTWLVAENIAWEPGKASSPRQVVAAWMSSAGHRLNILNPQFDEVGIAIDQGSPAGKADRAATYTTDFAFKK